MIVQYCHNCNNNQQGLSHSRLLLSNADELDTGNNMEEISVTLGQAKEDNTENICELHLHKAQKHEQLK